MLRGLNTAAESSSIEHMLDDAAELLASAPGVVFQKAVLRLDKALRLVLDQPQVLRFRSLRLANPIVASELLPCPGARALLECAGFEHKESSDGNTYGDPGYLILPLESDLAAVQAARSRLKLEAQRRVRWCTPEQLAAESARGELAMLPMPCMLGVDAGGAPLCLGRACVSQGVHPGSAPLVASSMPTTPAAATSSSATESTSTSDDGKSQHEIDGSGGGSSSSGGGCGDDSTTGDPEPLWGVRGGGCRMGYGGRAVIVDAWNAGGHGYEVLCAHPTALELVDPNNCADATTGFSSSLSNSSSSGRDSNASRDWPVRALVAGFETDGTPLYGAVARLDLDPLAGSAESDTKRSGCGGGGSGGSFKLSSTFRPRIPGKARPGLGGASCAFGGCEVTAEDFTLVCLAAHAILDDDEDGNGNEQQKVLNENRAESRGESDGEASGGISGGSDGDEDMSLELKVSQPCMPKPPSRRFMLSVAELLAWKAPKNGGLFKQSKKGGLDLPRASLQALTYASKPSPYDGRHRAAASPNATTSTAATAAAALAPAPTANEGAEVDDSARFTERNSSMSSEEPKPRVLMIHDMQGGYNDAADRRYLEAFRGWASIDEFCYFSHHLVTVPPVCWIEACHTRGVPCYGTLITEHHAWENSALLRSTTTNNRQQPSQRSASSANRYSCNLSAAVPDEPFAPFPLDIENEEFPAAKQLAKVMAWCGFDGWLVNIEAPLPDGARDVERLQRFLAALRNECRIAHANASVHAAAATATADNTTNDAADASRASTLPTVLQEQEQQPRHAEEENGKELSSLPLPKVLIYDSVSADGTVAWCSELSACHPKSGEPHANLSLLAHCDGILLDYKWSPEALLESRQVADALPVIGSDKKPGDLHRAAEEPKDKDNATATTNNGNSNTTSTSGSSGTSTSVSPHPMLRGSTQVESRADAAQVATSGRRCDVYAGLDVFGRHTWHAEGCAGTAKGVRAIAAAGLSLGLFAPGWVMEAGPGARVASSDVDAREKAAECDAAFWAEINTNRVRGSPKL